MSLSLAYGNRGVAKLIQSLQAEEPEEETSLTLLTLNGLLSNQENKMKAISHEPPLVPVLTKLLAAPDAETRKLSAQTLASLSLVYQGRLAVREADTVAPLTELVGTDEEAVAESSGAALLALSTSRDGCVVLAEHEADLVPTLTHALSAPTPVALNALSTLANLLRQDIGVTTALQSGIVPQLRNMILPMEFPPKVVVSALQATWNLANTPDGKVALVDAEFLPVLSHHCAQGDPQVRRLSAGCLMAMTINKQGKLESQCCLEPLVDLLLDASAAPYVDLGSVRSASLPPALRD
uniref:Armadillo repeat-containing protein 8 n=1 Tax=Chrysotila carterae TaxID=13221 RepID=A0A7S4B4T8_CHRCT